jgi:hypothetical protein
MAKKEKKNNPVSKLEKKLFKELSKDNIDCEKVKENYDEMVKLKNKMVKEKKDKSSKKNKDKSSKKDKDKSSKKNKDKSSKKDKKNKSSKKDKTY